jgi:N-acetylneuraminate synthase
LTPEEYAAPHPVPINAYGQTYGEHRERLEFSVEQHRELKAHAESLGVDYSASVWDMTSAREITELNPILIKVPSACNGNASLLDYLCEHYSGEIHVSVGMTTRSEEQKIVEFFRSRGRARDLVVYACTAGYPIADQDVCLLEIARLKRTYGGEVKAIGFSGHHLGIAIDIAAMVLGAEWIERHFTLDRTWKGTDHAASLEPDGMRRLVRDIASVSQALTNKSKEILPIEEAQRAKLKRLVQI